MARLEHEEFARLGLTAMLKLLSGPPDLRLIMLYYLVSTGQELSDVLTAQEVRWVKVNLKLHPVWVAESTEVGRLWSG